MERGEICETASRATLRRNPRGIAKDVRWERLFETEQRLSQSFDTLRPNSHPLQVLPSNEEDPDDSRSVPSLRSPRLIPRERCLIR